MNHPAPGELSSQLIGSLHGIVGRLEAALEPLGLSLAKYGMLARLVEAGEPLPLGTLAQRCACVRSNVTQLIDRLETDRLVRRADDAHDRRSVRAELTPEGRKRHADAVRALDAAERELYANLAPGDREILIRILSSLHRPV